MTDRLLSRSPIAFSAAFTVAVLMATPAIADQPTPEQLEAFEAHVERGASLLDDEDYAAGIEELKVARQIVDHPRLAVRIAEAYADWGRCARAEEEFEVLAEREDIDDETRQAVADSLEGLDDCVAMASLSVECTPEDARLMLAPREEAETDEKSVHCPFEGDIAARHWEVRAIAEGYEDAVESVAIEEGDAVELAMTLEETIEEIEPVDEDDTDWAPLVGYGAIGTGAALLVGGGILDRRAGDRATRLAAARDDGDQARIDDLESDARTARIANIALYAGGLTLIAGGVALQFVDLGSSDDEVAPGFSLHVGPGSVTTRLQW